MVAINLDDVADGLYDKDDDLSSSAHASTPTPTFARPIPAYADGKYFPSVLAPLTSFWTLLPLAFMTAFLFAWLFQKRFRVIHHHLKQRLGLPTIVRSSSESETEQNDELSAETAFDGRTENETVPPAPSASTDNSSEHPSSVV